MRLKRYGTRITLFTAVIFTSLVLSSCQQPSSTPEPTNTVLAATLPPQPTAALEIGADISPDDLSGSLTGGELIAFVSEDESGIKHLYTYHLPTTSLTSLPEPEGATSVSHPAWSPDGRYLAYSAKIGDRWDIYIANSDGTDIRNLTALTFEGAIPDWSPDGARLAYTCVVPEGFNICTIDLEGGIARRLTTGLTLDSSPSWSPDGNYIVFSSERSTIGGSISIDLYILRVEDGTIFQLTDDSGVENRYPKWSPDGKWIVFEQEAAGVGDIALIDPTGENFQLLTEGLVQERYPDWAPDGRTVIFQSDLEGEWGIYMIDPENLDEPSPLDLGISVQHPDWRTDPGSAHAETGIEIPLGDGLGASLEAEPPWLVFYAYESQTWFIANQDGSGKTALPMPPSYNTKGLVSPDGSRITYVSGSTADVIPDLDLIIATLPEGEVETTIPLYNPEQAEEAAKNSIMPGEEVISLESFAWSPDGRYLAFNGVIDGPSADLYLYDTLAESIFRLTYGLTQSHLPIWSPDGTWIVHLAVESFGTGAGWIVDSIWAVDPIDFKAVQLLDAEGRMHFIEGWTADGKLLLSEWDAWYGPNVLSLLPFGGQKEILFGGQITDLAINEDFSRFLFSVAGFAAKELEIKPGIYLLKHPGDTLDLVLSIDADLVQSTTWSETRQEFIVGTDEGVYFINSEGAVTRTIDLPGKVSISPDGKWMMVWDWNLHDVDYLWLYNLEDGSEIELARATEDFTSWSGFWTPDGESAFYVLNSGLYTVDMTGDAGGITPRLIHSGAAGEDESHDWVE
jgi:Tol biopolymer transport system component